MKRLMGTNVVRLTDRKYMVELRRRIIEDCSEMQTERIKHREVIIAPALIEHASTAPRCKVECITARSESFVNINLHFSRAHTCKREQASLCRLHCVLLAHAEWLQFDEKLHFICKTFIALSVHTMHIKHAACAHAQFNEAEREMNLILKGCYTPENCPPHLVIVHSISLVF